VIECFSHGCVVHLRNHGKSSEQLNLVAVKIRSSWSTFMTLIWKEDTLSNSLSMSSARCDFTVSHDLTLRMMDRNGFNSSSFQVAY
jgi:hypothetical protein